MSSRDTIKTKLQAWQEFADGYQAKAAAIQSDANLSKTGKDAKLAELAAANSAQVDKLRADALAAVDGAIRALEDDWSGQAAARLGDATYQAALSKACAALRDGALDEYDVKGLVGMFAGDHIAERQLQAAAWHGNNALGKDSGVAQAIIDAMPKGVDRSRTIRNLNSMGENIRANMRVGSEDGGLGSFQGNIDYLDTCAEDCSVNIR